MLNAYYPNTTADIIHKGMNGNIYRLDCIEKCTSLKEALSKLPNFNVISVSSEDDNRVAESIIDSIHSKKILASYKTGKPKELSESSGIMWQPRLLNYVLEQALASNMAVENLKQSIFSIVISGGGHHAEKDTPFGFCPINTMAISCLKAVKLGFKVAIMDLDIHYSNGCFDILQNRDNIKVYSLWNQKLDKWKYFESTGNLWHRKVTNINDYFEKLNELMVDVKKYKPTLIIYHLGLDVLETDRMGGIKGMSYINLRKRDKIIKKLIIRDLECKGVIFLGGSYIDRTNGEIVASEQKQNATNYQLKVLEMFL